MLSFIRRHLGNWFARVLFGVLVLSFAAWGVGDMLRNLGTDTAVAHVAGQRIGPAATQTAYQNALNRLSQMLPSGQQPTAAMRRVVAIQAVQRLITQISVQAEAKRLGLVVPNAALRQAVFAMPAFQGSNGAFDKTKFEQVLQSNGLTQVQFLALMRQDLAQSQLLDAIGTGANAPRVLTAALFAYQYEKRTATAVLLPFAAAPAPKTPDAAVLKRWWANNPKTFSTAEYRRIRVVVLSPDVLAKGIKVSEAALKAAYAGRAAVYHKPERRSAEILLASDQAKAAALAAQWRAGASWTEMQQAAKTAGATAVSLADALPAEFPDPALAKAVFAALPKTVAGPVKTPLGWHVIKVTAIAPGTNTTFAEAKPSLEAEAARQQAVNLVFSRATKFEDAVAAQPTLEKMPGDLGLVGVTGTLDKAGLTPEGTPAPLPGSAALRKAIIAAAFSTQKNNLASVVQGPGQSYYALTVQAITPPHVEPYELIKAKVLADWTAHERRKEQNRMATRLMLAVNHGTPLAEAAKAEALTAITLPPTERSAPPPGVPQPLLGPLFALHLHRATMVETTDGFVTAELMAIDNPTEASNPIGFKQMQTQLAQSIGSDLEQIFISAVREQAHPRINMPALDRIAQQ
ncbi:MAG: SurA N-terminal domain-containing protein [Rhodospirillales bacterium]|nr:SurA N-terminal domain-containing protein [Rhodospirillales bacterium]